MLGEKDGDDLNQDKSFHVSSLPTCIPTKNEVNAVFHDIHESYPNDAGIIVNYTLEIKETAREDVGSMLWSTSFDYVKSISGDRIGIFKVPFISPRDILAFEWVNDTDCTNEGFVNDVGSVVFESINLPKENDFYIFQYLRVAEGAEQKVLGASIPFQLIVPKCGRMNQQEQPHSFAFKNATSQSPFNSACLITPDDDKVKFDEDNASDRKTSAEKQTVENNGLLDEAMSFVQIEDKKSQNKSKLDQVRKELEETLLKNKKLEQSLQNSTTHSKDLQIKVDELTTKCQKQNQEIEIVQENQKHLAARVKDTRQLLVVATESKEETANLLKSSIIRSDDLQKEVGRLKANLLDHEKLNATIEELSAALKSSKDELEENKKKYENNLDKLHGSPI